MKWSRHFKMTESLSELSKKRLKTHVFPKKIAIKLFLSNDFKNTAQIIK